MSLFLPLRFKSHLKMLTVGCVVSLSLIPTCAIFLLGLSHFSVNAEHRHSQALKWKRERKKNQHNAFMLTRSGCDGRAKLWQHLIQGQQGDGPERSAMSAREHRSRLCCALRDPPLDMKPFIRIFFLALHYFHNKLPPHLSRRHPIHSSPGHLHGTVNSVSDSSLPMMNGRGPCDFTDNGRQKKKKEAKKHRNRKFDT